MTTIDDPRTIVMILFWISEIAITIMLSLSALGRLVLGKSKTTVFLFIGCKLKVENRMIKRLALCGLIFPLLFCGFILIDTIICPAFHEISRDSKVEVLKSFLFGSAPIAAIGLIPFMIGRHLIKCKKKECT